MAALAGFLLASGHHVNVVKLLITIVSVSLIIASGCVYNNYLDREIDKKMNRTKNRPSVLGLISVPSAMVYATVLLVVGFGLLLLFINVTTAVIGLIGIVDYVVLYGYTKRKSVYGTLVGSISGATPPLAGYTAVTGHLNAAGILLFLILTFWQMPHFYAIAVFRMKDYAAAKLPVLPVSRGVRTAKLHIAVYIVWFIVATVLLYTEGYAGVIYLLVMLALGLWWLRAALLGFRKGIDDTAWARAVFFKSLIVLTAFCVVVSIGALF
jgi:heme o synthase